VLWQRYCTASSGGRQPNFEALNRGRQLRSAGRPSGWALAHILVVCILLCVLYCCFGVINNNNGDCLEGKREKLSILFCAILCQQLRTVQCAHTWTDLTVLWICFCLTGPISLCLDSFLYMCVSLCIAWMCRMVTWWGGPGGTEAYL